MGRCPQLAGSWILLGIQQLMHPSCVASLVLMASSLAELTTRCEITSNSANHDTTIPCICLASTCSTYLVHPDCMLANLAMFTRSTRDLQQGTKHRLAQNMNFPFLLATPLYHFAMALCGTVYKCSDSDRCMKTTECCTGHGGEEGCQADGGAVAGSQVLWRLSRPLHCQLPYRSPPVN